MITKQVLTAISTLISIILYVYTLNIRNVKSRQLFSLLMMFITVFMAGSFFEQTAEDFMTTLLWRNICLTGYLLILPTFISYLGSRNDSLTEEILLKKQQDELLESEIKKNRILQNKYENEEKIDNLVRQNSLKDKLLLIVSHDIRLPMASMISLLEILEDDIRDDNDDNIEIIKSVKEQVNNTFKMVENLLEWIKSQMEGLVYNPLVWDISKLVKEVINMLQNTIEAKNIKIADVTVKGTTVYADREMLELVLRNLIFNAIKFTSYGGTISVYSYDSGNERIIAVKDSGIGIDGEKVKTLFSEVNISSSTGTAGEKGAGLGLLICKEFISRNGGRIWVDSIPGEGSTFYFSILSAEKLR